MANAYEVAIKLSMENSVSPVLAMIAKDMLGLNMSAKELEKSFAKMGTGMKLALGAGVIAAAGVEAVNVVLDLAKHGEKLLHQQNVMLRNGQSYNEVMNLTADAYERITKAVPTATGSDALRTITELRSVLGSTEAAVGQAPFALKLDALISNLTGKDSEGAGFAIWRALEMKGMTATDPQGASKLAATMAQVIGGSGGKVTAEGYQAFAKRGGAAWMGASPHLIAGAGSVLIGDMGGDTAGTAYSTFYNSVMGAAQMRRQQVEAYRSAGLLDESKVHKIKGSSAVSFDPGAIKGVMEHSKDLDEWVATTMAPAFHRAAEKMAAASHGSISEDSAYNSLIAKAGGNKNTQRLMHMWGDPEFIAQIDKDRALWAQTQGLDPAYGTMLGDPGNKARGPSGRMSEASDTGNAAKTIADYGAVMKAMQTQWESLLQAVGGPVATGMIPILKSMTTEFNALGAAANAHGSDIAKVMDAIITPLKGLAQTLVVIGPPIARVAQEFADMGNAIVAFQNKIASTMDAFWSKVIPGYHSSGPIDLNAKPGDKGYDPLSSIVPPKLRQTTPSGIALSGGADNGKLAMASAMPVNLPSVNANVTATGTATVKIPSVIVNVSGSQIVAALAGELRGVVEAMFHSMGMSGTNGDSGHDGRASPAYPDHMHGAH